MDLARDYLYAEIDLKNIIQLLRLSKFLVKVNMKMHQRRAVNFSRKFIIDQDKVESKRQRESIQGSKSKQTIDGALAAIKEDMLVKKEEDVLNQLVSQLNPKESVIDRRLLYELTGMVVDLDDNY